MIFRKLENNIHSEEATIQIKPFREVSKMYSNFYPQLKPHIPNPEGAYNPYLTKPNLK